MSNLVVLVFDSEDEAAKVRDALRRQERGGTLNLEDTAVVVRGTDGKVRTHNQVSDTTKVSATVGGFLGLLVAVFFPFAGIAMGIAGGALLGRLLDRGVDGAFVKEVGEALKPGTSALFVLTSDATPDAAFAALRSFNGHVYHTTLGPEAEETLRRNLHDQSAPQI